MRMEVSYAFRSHHRGPVLEHTSSSLLADTLCRAIDLGVRVVDAACADEATHLWCEVLTPDLRCPGCGGVGVVRDHIVRELVDLPIAAGARAVVHVRIPAADLPAAGMRDRDLPGRHRAARPTAVEGDPPGGEVDPATAGLGSNVGESNRGRVGLVVGHGQHDCAGGGSRVDLRTSASGRGAGARC